MVCHQTKEGNNMGFLLYFRKSIKIKQYLYCGVALRINLP